MSNQEPIASPRSDLPIPLCEQSISSQYFDWMKSNSSCSTEAAVSKELWQDLLSSDTLLSCDNERNDNSMNPGNMDQTTLPIPGEQAVGDNARTSQPSIDSIPGASDMEPSTVTETLQIMQQVIAEWERDRLVCDFLYKSTPL